MMWTIADYICKAVGHSLTNAYFCNELKRNIDYGKTNYCHKRKNPLRGP